ncbi:alanine--tRNA ligase [Chitinophaga ginsengisegetis]|uniref:alanine--tRNA ligase n=1 Tax=Chitinophaga ginsengisegetis TaxID=393003 RepID=UPI000DBA68AA|nr:alanine--tRNA ligase [Chitinophaga ginsengisegetis]MDR6565893.1 alanyl-tRNA synthetase [Chitinophaga ginsengisegetis]MDR6645622.1 alanyl-tRNA synthetase [Chitinophaga ginsengisegetis]MDR6651786.1 alanyl-tRNA synthetase [Chitinophaga ginsengisegetis]
MTASEIRQQFLDFFASKGHQIVPSAPIVIKNDPTLMFTNAGMNQFKDYFLGNRVPPNKRVVDTQKCLRVSGKHNDLEEVGIDTYHHTMFEMLGNWSFGDYFKKEAIAWSWELLTEVYKIPKDKLYVTVFQGDEKENLPKDQEAYDFWKEHIAEDRILLGNKKDNFWEMGDTGPCGPCSEIHVDCRPAAEKNLVDGKTLVNADHPQVIEIWNNVFMQFNRLKDKSLEPLPAQHVDTGMGLERLVRVLQDKTSNYDTDLFMGTIHTTEGLTGKKYAGTDDKKDVAFRVIADHIRAISFTIADGQLPSNTGAGYVIRRILRRAVRYYFSFLDVKKPLLHELVPVLAAQFSHVFPELQQQVDFVKKVVFEEENNFLRTLESGIRRIEDFIQHAATKAVDGKTAFELYDTYGFPYDLTSLIAAENGFSVDEKGFDAAMKQQKDRSRAATELDMGDWVILDETPNSVFVGYEQLESTTKLLKYRTVKAKGKEQFQLVLGQTPFYAESGGQVGDTGTLHFGDEVIHITDTKKENNLTIHFADKLPAQPDAPVKAAVAKDKRHNTERHHSATHLLHAALRQVLGTHVAQKGSLVNADALRFDFSHFAKVTDEELAQIEAIVNEKIRENIPVVIRELPKEEALKLGAMALFGEKYGDTVRVVIIDPAYSVELCGGTHISSTGELGQFKFVSEGAVAAGVRRVEAVTGAKAEAFVNEQLQQLKEIKAALKNPKELVKSIETLIQDKSSLEKQLETLELEKVRALAAVIRHQAENINGVNFLGQVVNVGNAEGLKQLSFQLKNEIPDHVLLFVANIGGKASVALSIDEKLVTSKGWEAPKIIKEYIAPLIKGGGGGQKTFATAGGQETDKLDQVIAAVKKLLTA